MRRMICYDCKKANDPGADACVACGGHYLKSSASRPRPAKRVGGMREAAWNERLENLTQREFSYREDDFKEKLA